MRIHGAYSRYRGHRRAREFRRGSRIINASRSVPSFSFRNGPYPPYPVAGRARPIIQAEGVGSRFHLNRGPVRDPFDFTPLEIDADRYAAKLLLSARTRSCTYIRVFRSARARSISRPSPSPMPCPPFPVSTGVEVIRPFEYSCRPFLRAIGNNSTRTYGRSLRGVFAC